MLCDDDNGVAGYVCMCTLIETSGVDICRIVAGGLDGNKAIAVDNVSWIDISTWMVTLTDQKDG